MERIKINSLFIKNKKSNPEPIRISGNEDLESFEDFSFPEGYYYDFTIWPGENEILLLTGTIEFKWQATCFLCLDPAEDFVEVEITEDIYPENYDPYQAAEEDYILDGNLEESEFIFHNGRTVDLSKYFEDTVYLNLPLIVKCKEDCLGLCASCGKKNDEEHKCIEESTDLPKAVRPEFDKLRDLL